MFFEDAIGCTIDQAYQDMVATKKRFHKTDKVQGFHLVQSFAEGEVSPELAHLIGVELAERLLRGQFEVVITTHLNTSHFHNHLVWNSVSMEDGHKYHSNEQSYYMEVRKISDELCRKYGLSVIQTNQKKGIHYVQWKAEKEGKPTWRTAIRSDIRETVKASYSWTQFVKEMETRGYVWRTDRKYLALKAPGMERYVRLRSLGKGYGEMEIREWILRPKIRETEKVYLQWSKQRKKRTGLEELRKHCGYDMESNTYDSGTFFYRGTSPFGEVVDYLDNSDGTLTLYVDAVWPDRNTDCAFKNEIVIKPYGDGTCQYLSNKVQKIELDIPVYEEY